MNGLSNATETVEQADADADPETGAAGAGIGGARSRRGVFLLLAGLVVTGIAAGYNWVRSLPKD